MSDPLVRFVVEEDRLLAVVDPFAIENTQELENFAQQLIAKAIEERHRRGLSVSVLIEEA
jgi:3-deoxy-D-arabino-heptulosonate 7-phosphate (DAHP) synthase